MGGEKSPNICTVICTSMFLSTFAWRQVFGASRVIPVFPEN